MSELGRCGSSRPTTVASPKAVSRAGAAAFAAVGAGELCGWRSCPEPAPAARLAVVDFAPTRLPPPPPAAAPPAAPDVAPARAAPAPVAAPAAFSTVTPAGTAASSAGTLGLTSARHRIRAFASLDTLIHPLN